MGETVAKTHQLGMRDLIAFAQVMRYARQIELAG